MGFSEIIKDGSIIIASWAVIYGVDSWRREFKGKRQAELAEEVLSLFYEAVDAVRHIRSAFRYESEGSSRKQNENETPEQKEALDKAYVVFERYQKHQEVFNKLHSLRYRFKTHFGEEAAKPFEDLRLILNKVFVSARMLSQLWATQNRYRSDEAQKRFFESIKKHENNFWEALPEEDTINPELEKCVSDIEGTCQSILTGKGTLFSLLNYPISSKANKKKA